MTTIKIILILVTIIWFLVSLISLFLGLYWCKLKRDGDRFWRRNRGNILIFFSVLTLLFGLGGTQFLLD